MAHVDCSVDANILLDWLLDRDASRVATIERLLQASRHISVFDLTILEIAYVFEKVYRLERRLVADNLYRIIEDDLFHCNRNLFRHVLPLYLEHATLSFADCCAVYQAQLTDALPFHTFDKALIDHSAGLARRPV